MSKTFRAFQSFQKRVLSHRRWHFVCVWLVVAAVLSICLSLPSWTAETQSSEKNSYFPPRGNWEKRSPEELGMDSRLLKEAVSFAISNEWTGPKDLKIPIAQAFEREPFGELLGPTKDRGETSGMVIKDGYIVAEWGDTKRVDMTFSASKSYLSTTCGLALDDGLIYDVHDRVKEYVLDGKFDSEHNAKIEWHHLLNQSSDWSGTLWDKPDWSDRPPRNVTWDDLRNRPLKEPGTSYKYNDVRVNLLAYSLLQVWRKPLPMVLKDRIMDPIGASSTWRWHGYRNSWVLIDGVQMQSVSGGGHWGGGFFICTEDHARFGLLFLRQGQWNGKQLISKQWIKMLRVPSPANPNYGYMWWLNTGQTQIPSAPESVYYAAGFGGNYVVIDEEHDLLIVVRWVGSTKILDGIVQRVLASIQSN